MTPQMVVRAYWYNGEKNEYRFHTYAAALDCARHLSACPFTCLLAVVCDQSEQLPLFDWTC